MSFRLPSAILCLACCLTPTHWLGTAIAATPRQAATNQQTPTTIGNQVESFTLPTHLGRNWSLDEIADKRVVAIAFLGTECPLAKLYGPRLAELHTKLEAEGVAIVGINSNTQDSMTELTAYANRYGITFPLLKDVGNRIANVLGAQRTPEVFLLDEKRIVRYHGRIDDQYGVGYSRDKVQRRDLAVAIRELLDGKPVSVPTTEAIGCHIGRVKEKEPSGDITYTNQIARILNKRCVECHREGELAPFSLTSYSDIQGWEDTILEVIDDNRMPPWFADPDHGEFDNDARLTEEEKDLIFQWVENGMPEGDPKHLPAAPEFIEGWRIPAPDEVYYMRETPFDVPAEGVVSYKHFEIDPGWDEDKYICAAEARPGNSAVVHHILVYVLPKGQRAPDLRSILVGYAPGSTPVDLRDGTAIKVPANSKLLFQMHYTPNGYAESDRSYAGIKFIDATDVKHVLQGRLVMNSRFEIPPQEPNHVVVDEATILDDELLVSMTPHMHLRGKAFRFDANYPDGKEEVLLNVPEYDFNWQLKYTLAEPKLLPRGTKIRCTAVFDNSEQNLVNPDPTAPVRFGEQSWEEMMIGFFETVPADSSKYLPDVSRDVLHDPSGTWTWIQDVGGKATEATLSLRLEQNQLTGSVSTPELKTEIQRAKIDGDAIRFRVPLPQGGMILDFDGKVAPAKIDGTIDLVLEGFGKTIRELPWKAVRSGSPESDNQQ